MFRKDKAVVLLSGGLDSVVSLAIAIQEMEIVMALTFNYGQRAYGKEIRASRQIADYYRVPHQVIPLPWFSGLLPKALHFAQEASDRGMSNPWGTASIKDEHFLEAKPVWVPNRNGVFLNIAASFAEAHEASHIIFGANAEEGEAFPDNTPDFQAAINQSFQFSTLNHPQVLSPVGDLNKSEIMDQALALKVPLDLIWSCYNDGMTQCGTCPSCYRLKQAIGKADSAALLEGKLSFTH